MSSTTRRPAPIGPLLLLLVLLGAWPAVSRLATAEEPGGGGSEERALLPNAVAPADGLVAGGQPSDEQLVALREAGYRTVVNLRGTSEGGSGRDEVEALGMTYVALPIAGAEGLTAENALAFARILDEIERPAAIHCASGNRVGALFALKAYHAEGAEPQEALELGRDAGLTGLEDAVRRHLETVPRAVGEPSPDAGASPDAAAASARVGSRSSRARSRIGFAVRP